MSANNATVFLPSTDYFTYQTVTSTPRYIDSSGSDGSPWTLRTYDNTTAGSGVTSVGNISVLPSTLRFEQAPLVVAAPIFTEAAEWSEFQEWKRRKAEQEKELAADLEREISFED